MPRDPCFALTYDILKAGKSLDLLATFTSHALYCAAPGALAPAEEVLAMEQPVAKDLETFKDIQEFAEKTQWNGKIGLVIDDATLVADRTVNALRAKGLGGWDLWGAVTGSAVRMRDSLRRRGVHVAMSCHPAPAGIRDGVRHLGGPAFPGQVASKLPAAADLLLRGEPRPEGPGFGWPRVYRTALHPDWMQGSRYNTPDMAPMNLGEILRLAGYTIPRLPGLEWQEQLADALARRLVEVGLGNEQAVKDSLARVLERALKQFTKSEAHAYWALRDGYDRAVLWTAQAVQRRSMWGI